MVEGWPRRRSIVCGKQRGSSSRGEVMYEVERAGEARGEVTIVRFLRGLVGWWGAEGAGADRGRVGVLIVNERFGGEVWRGLYVVISWVL